MYFSRPDESFMFGTATGTVATGYLPGWIVDGSAGKPAKGTTSLSLAITALASRNVGIVAAINHNVDAGHAITFSGGVSATVTPGTLPADTIPLNPWALVGPTSASGCTVAVSGNSVAVVIGEAWAGVVRQLPDLLQDQTLAYGTPTTWEGAFSSLPPYDIGISQRRLTGEIFATDAQMALITEWYNSTRNGTRPTLLVPEEAVPTDAWLVTFQYEAKQNAPNVHHVTFDFLELPRYRW